MKKRLISFLLTASMLLSALPVGVMAARDNPWMTISTDTQVLVESGWIVEGAEFPEGLSYAYDEARDVHVLTMENVTLNERLFLDGEWGAEESTKFEIVLKGSNVIDTRECDYGEIHDILGLYNADVTITSASEGAELSLYGIDCAALSGHEGTVTIDGVRLNARCEIGENPEGGQGLSGSSDYLITGGAELNIYGEWMGVIISGSVAFEDCTVNTNRIHVHSHVDEDEFGNVFSDQRTMTIGEGAIVNIIDEENTLNDSVLMLLDGSTLKIAGGVLNCDLNGGPSNWMQVGYDGDCAVNTVLLESGELNVFGDSADEWQDAMYLDTGRLVQTGGKLTIQDAFFGLGVGDNASASFEGGQALFENCYTGIFIAEDSDGWDGDLLALAGTDMTFNVGRFGIYHGVGRASISDGSIEINAGPSDELVQAIYVAGKLVMSGGDVSVVSDGIGMLVDYGGEFILQGGKMGLRNGDRGTWLSFGLTDLRGGELNLKGNSHTFWGIKRGDYLHLGENMFLRTEDATLVEMYDEEEGVDCGYYANSEGEPCTNLSFGDNGGVFSGQLDVPGSELSVGVPFVVSADLALGEKNGTAVFVLPDGLSVKGKASVNGVSVESVYDASSNALTVPIHVPGAAVRFYAVADRTMEDVSVFCTVYVGENKNNLNSGTFRVDGLRMDLPDTIAMTNISMSGSAAPGGTILVYEVSDEDTPVVLNGDGFTVNSLGDFSGSVELPEPVANQTLHTYRLRVELLCGGNVIDAVEKSVSYASHAAKLKYLNIQNDYHGAKLDEILRNDIIVDYQNGALYINESDKTKAYNYFPEYPGFFFAAEFEESHANGCCEPGEESNHVISARVEVKGSRGQVVSVPLYYNVDMGRFEGWYEFPDWAPESFAVYWVEEGVVNRESFYSSAIESMGSYGGSGQRYEDIQSEATENVLREMEDYFSQITEEKVSENRSEYYDVDGQRIFSVELDTLEYSSIDLSEFEDIRGDGSLMVKTEHNVDDYSVSMTVAASTAEHDPVAFKQTMYIDYVTAGSPMVRAVSGATPGQRSAVYVAKHIPRVGAAVQAVDSKLLYDSLLEFDAEYANDLVRLTEAISSTMTYRCPYTGKQIRRGHSEEAARILQQLLDLQGEYFKEYEENKENIKDDMKESLMDGVTLGINKFGNKKAKAALELYNNIQDQLDTIEGYRDDAEALVEFIQDPNGSLQESIDQLMTKEGMLKAGTEYAHEHGLIDDDTKDLLDDLANPDGTYQDAHKFMVKYRDKLTDLTDAYTKLLLNEVQYGGTGGDDGCEPPEDPEIPTPELPGEAGGEETPVPAIKDPSGYVYEGIESNRLSDVEVTLYYWDGEEAPAETAGELNLDPVDMSIFNQANPLFTDALGQYQWMVPDGWWQVKYEKEGYVTTYSQWLPVPPPQTQVNIELLSMAQPTISFEDGDGCFFLYFDRYVLVDSVEAELTIGEEMIYSRMTALDTAIAPDGETRLATSYVLYYNKWDYPQPTRARLSVTESTTYSGVTLEEPIEKLVTLNPSDPTSHYWSGEECIVSLTRELADYIIPLAAGYTNGVMTDCVYVTMDGVELTGDTVTVFFLDRDSYSPLCPAMSWSQGQ